MYCRRRWGQSTAWKIQTIEQGRGRNGEEEGWWKNFCVSTRSRTRHPLYDDQWIRHYLKTPSWIQNSNQYPRFHVPSLFPHYCTHKLCKAKFWDISPGILSRKVSQPATNCKRRFFNGFWSRNMSSITYQKSPKIRVGEVDENWVF